MSATPAETRIRTDVMYMISSEVAIAARSLNLSVLPGFGSSDALIQHDVLRAITTAGWVIVSEQTTTYDGVVKIAMMSPQQAAGLSVAAAPVAPPPPPPPPPPAVVEPPFTHEEYERAFNNINIPCSNADCTCMSCRDIRKRHALLEEQKKKRGVLPPPAVKYSWGISRDLERQKMLLKNAEIIERVLSPAVKQPIIVHHYTFYTDDAGMPAKDGFFHVFINHQPVNSLGDNLGEETKTPFPISLWGIPSEQSAKNYHRGIYPWFDALPIITPEGNEIAAVSKNRLHIYFPNIFTASDNELKINEKIYEAVAAVIKEPEKYKRVITRETYTAFCSGRVEKETKALEDRKEKLVAEIAQLRRTLTERITESSMIVRQAQMSRANVGNSTVRFAEEFDALSTRFPDVDKLMVFGKIIMIDVKTQYVVDPRTNKEHELGRFRIIMNFATCSVRMYNLDRSVSAYKMGMQAPHVFPDGHGCLGNIENILPQLIARMDVPTILQTLLVYLSSVNTDDAAGRYVERWPVRGGEKTEHELPPTYKVTI